ncbi:hypothetical protein SASPL_141042 [Salvia splendens]|uniref:Morc S5 domain-containing protein n=1 Tax=Salvia splendens TaxID=180675 RepID=A0A8X8WRH8_SALSN|nr:hypothetical protein SASPL_141042 [Salvia splendens]
MGIRRFYYAKSKYSVDYQCTLVFVASSIAELLDNAVDEIESGATFVNVDQIYNSKDNSPALLFQDDGGGMDPEGMRKYMSLGYSSKTSNTTIGQLDDVRILTNLVPCLYHVIVDDVRVLTILDGKGFKTSTMRLGADVICRPAIHLSSFYNLAVLSFSRATQSIGLLSYTFLRRTGQDDVIVPMIDFDISDNWAEPIIYSSMDDWSSNLKTILEWSPFASKDDLMQQFENLGSHGTKVIICNLWMNDEGIYELNFDDDHEDITLRDEAKQGGTGNTTKTSKRVLELQSHISYCIRFLLRVGKPVEQFSIADDLKHAMTVVYNPQVVTVKTVIGFTKEAPALGVCGFNIYHKNRLIRVHCFTRQEIQFFLL